MNNLIIHPGIIFPDKEANPYQSPQPLQKETIETLDTSEWITTEQASKMLSHSQPYSRNLLRTSKVTGRYARIGAHRSSLVWSTPEVLTLAKQRAIKSNPTPSNQ